MKTSGSRTRQSAGNGGETRVLASAATWVAALAKVRIIAEKPAFWRTRLHEPEYNVLVSTEAGRCAS